MARKVPLEEIDPSKLQWIKVCRNGHVGPNGWNVGYVSGGCLHCSRYLPLGPFTHVFKGIEDKFPRVPFTKEESRLRTIARSRAWTKKNMDKHLSYVKKYQAKDEVKQREKERREERERLKYRSPEERAAAKEASRAAFKQWYAELKTRPEEYAEYKRKHAEQDRIRRERKKAEKAQNEANRVLEVTERSGTEGDRSGTE